jgi:hypothetical protein
VARDRGGGDLSGYQEYGGHEFKYVLSLSARAEVLHIVGDRVEPDPHTTAREDGLVGYYTHTIYLDTADLLGYHERLSDGRLRNRLRVRTYGRPGDRAPVFLEIKRKVDEWVVKHRVRVCDADTWTAHPHDRPWSDYANVVSGEGRFAATHFLRLVEGRRVPVSAVQYFREAYIDRRGDGYGKARLTLDREVFATVRPDGRRLYGPADVELIPRDWMVMEFKYSRDRPRWMREICRGLRLRALPMPKFGLSVARGVRAGRLQEQRRLLPRSILQMGWSP